MITLNLPLNWPSESRPLHLVSLWDPTPPIPQIAHSRAVARQPAPLCTFPGSRVHGQAAAFSSWCPCMAHTLQEKVLMVGHWRQPKLQCLLGGPLGSVAPRRMAAGLSVIGDFCGIPGVQHWQQSLLSWWISLLHPMSPWDPHYPTHKLPTVGPLPGSQPSACAFPGTWFWQ